MTLLIAAKNERSVIIPAEGMTLPGALGWPTHPSGIVLFSHGTDSSRSGPRNRLVARQLRAAGLATLQFDLLTETEAADLSNRLDVESLARRLIAGIHWVGRQPGLDGLPIGLLGEGIGAAAVLIAAAMAPESVAAVVTRGGCPDLAGNDLPRIKAPTLLLVGNLDTRVGSLHGQVIARLTCQKQLMVIPGLSLLSEEPDVQEQATGWATEWFVRHLAMEPEWHRSHATPREWSRLQLAMH
jgi:putative phosphoribosyl transferase